MSKWRQHSLESGKNGDLGPNSWSCRSRFTSLPSESEQNFYFQENSHTCNPKKWQKHDRIPGEWLMLRFSLPCFGYSPVILIWAACIWLLLLVETPCDWNTKWVMSSKINRCCHFLMQRASSQHRVNQATPLDEIPRSFSGVYACLFSLGSVLNLTKSRPYFTTSSVFSDARTPSGNHYRSSMRLIIILIIFAGSNSTILICCSML